MKHTNNIISQILKITPILLMLSSCYSEMKVKVDTIDRYSLLQSQVYKSLSQQNLSEFVKNDAFKEKVKALFKQKATEIQQEAVDKGLFEAHATIIEMVSQNVADTVMETISTEIDNLQEELKSNKSVDVQKRLNDLLLGKPSILFNKFAAELASSVPRVPAKAKESDKKLTKDQPNPELMKIALKQEAAVQVQMVKIITQYGESIINDPAASIIAMAPRKYWRRYGYKVNIITDDPNKAKRSGQAARMNKVTVRTFMGNSDIAVKMEAPGMFVVKGVRLDADAAVKASFKVLNQGIKYFAYANGIPVNSPAGSAENTGKIVHLPEKAQNDSLRIAIDNFGNVDKQDKAAFFNIVFSQLSNLDVTRKDLTDDQVKQAIDLIQNAYNIYIKKTEKQQNEIPSK